MRFLQWYDRAIVRAERPSTYVWNSPNRIALLEIPRKEILKVSVSTCAADRPKQFHIKDNLLLDIDDYVSVEVQTSDRVQKICSIFNRVNTLVEQLK